MDAKQLDFKVTWRDLRDEPAVDQIEIVVAEDVMDAANRWIQNRPSIAFGDRIGISTQWAIVSISLVQSDNHERQFLDMRQAQDRDSLRATLRFRDTTIQDLSKLEFGSGLRLELLSDYPLHHIHDALQTTAAFQPVHADWIDKLLTAFEAEIERRKHV